MEKKKIIKICIISAVVILAIVLLIMSANGKKVSDNIKTKQFYQNLTNKNSYNFTITLDESNKMQYAKSNNMAYIDTIQQGIETKFIIKDGNSYLVDDEEKINYKYQNNETDLNKIEDELEQLNNLQATVGKEKIENKKYEYEEYNIRTSLIFKEDIEEDADIKTRFYYDDNNNLVYIRTIIGEYKETAKVDISNEVNSQLFEIPSDYEEI